MECHECVYGSLIRPVESLINRTQILLQSISLLFLIYYRVSFFFQNPPRTGSRSGAPSFPIWLLVFGSELLLSFIWLLGRACRWRRPESTETLLPSEEEEEDQGLPVPAIDVFICTADPEKEPTLEVMNTFISAMALDYPPDKLHLYFSDDAASPATLHAITEARRFARSWVPFCRKYRITQPCPEAYFSAAGEKDRRRHIPTDHEFLEHQLIMEEKYEEFKNGIKSGTKRWVQETATTSRHHHPALVQIIKCNESDGAEESRNQIQMPRVVYVSREKKPSQPHHFKLRVSGAMSNSAYILVLDCDMYCNDPTSARRAMWFHLHHPHFSHSLSFVQFPQKFYTVTKNDIYDSQLRSIFTVEWSGMNRLRGPILSGTCFYIKRLSLYGTSPQDNDPLEHREDFGASNKFIKSVDGINGRDEEAELLASCTYENGSEWGQKIGFLYDSVVEDFLTSLVLHCKGWRSVYCNPERAQFLGSGTTRLNEVLVQGTRWSSGLLEVAISRFSPLVYGCRRMCVLQSMCYTELAFYPLCSFSIWCFATIPQLCLMIGVPIFPKVSSPFFLVYCFIFISSTSIHLHEVLISGGSLKKWINEQRIWMIKGITCRFYGSLDGLMKKIGLRNASFVPTNKVVDDDQIKRYNMDIYDFQASTLFLAPLAGLVFLNLVSFTIGVGRVAGLGGDWEEIFGQLFLCFYILFMSFPIIEAILIRSDKGRFPFKVTLGSVLVVLIFLYLELKLFM